MPCSRAGSQMRPYETANIPDVSILVTKCGAPHMIAISMEWSESGVNMRRIDPRGLTLQS